ncbi:NUDIX hydrolase [Enterococcus faecalis]
MGIPVFRQTNEQQEFQKRLGAYIIISRQQQNEIVLVQAPNGAYFLPGGEIESGETKEAALHREVLEELGMVVNVSCYLGQADEYFYSNHRQTAYYNPGFFFVADAWQQKCAPLEKNNHLVWITPAKAIALLKRGSHQWAVQQWLQRQNA